LLTDTKYTAAPLVEGKTYYYRLRARDGLNQSTAWSPVVHSLQDTAPPVSTINAPAAAALLKGTGLTLTGTASDSAGIARVEVSTDGGDSWTEATGKDTWSLNWVLPSDGRYTIKVRATDISGRVEQPARSVTVTVDNTAPRLTHAFPYAGACVATATPTLSADVIETGTGINASSALVLLDGKDYPATVTSDGISYTPATALANGEHACILKLADLAGNGAETPKVKFTVDTDTPLIRVSQPASASLKTGSDKATISGQITDTTAIKAKALVNGAPGDVVVTGTANDFSFQVTLNEGANVVVLTAEDQAGHAAATTLSIFRDSRGPSISVYGPDSSTANRKVTVSGQVEDQSNITSVSISVNGAAVTASVTRGSFSQDVSLRAGSNTIEVRATDEVGNTATSTRTVKVEEPKTGGLSDMAAPLGLAGLALGLLALVIGVMAFVASRRARSATTAPPVEETATVPQYSPAPEPAPEPEVEAPREPVHAPKPRKKPQAHAMPPAQEPQRPPEPKGGGDEFRP
jgi:hypothetical protein